MSGAGPVGPDGPGRARTDGDGRQGWRRVRVREERVRLGQRVPGRPGEGEVLAVEQGEHRGHLLADPVEQVLLLRAPRFARGELAGEAAVVLLPDHVTLLEGLELAGDRLEQRRLFGAKRCELLVPLAHARLQFRESRCVLTGRPAGGIPRCAHVLHHRRRLLLGLPQAIGEVLLLALHARPLGGVGREDLLAELLAGVQRLAQRPDRARLLVPHAARGVPLLAKDVGFRLERSRARIARRDVERRGGHRAIAPVRPGRRVEHRHLVVEGDASAIDDLVRDDPRVHVLDASVDPVGGTVDDDVEADAGARSQADARFEEEPDARDVDDGHVGAGEQARPERRELLGRTAWRPPAVRSSGRVVARHGLTEVALDKQETRPRPGRERRADARSRTDGSAALSGYRTVDYAIVARLRSERDRDQLVAGELR